MSDKIKGKSTSKKIFFDFFYKIRLLFCLTRYKVNARCYTIKHNPEPNNEEKKT